MKKINLLDMNRATMRDFFISINENAFCADQVMKWIYKNYCDDFNKMTNLNQSLRKKLKKIAEIKAPEINTELISKDGTIKWNMNVSEQQIETIYIPSYKRTTLCISSQIGCLLKCQFCYTAKQGFNRNLTVSEIVGQIWRASKTIFNRINNIRNPITNIVIMGMGEPLLNLNNIITSIEIMLDSFGFNFSKRKITLSTAGIVPAIKKLINKVDIILAISLHAPNNYIRNNVMPINKKYNINKLFSSIKYYINKSKANRGRITIEYVMLNNINDKIIHAHQLANLLKNMPCKINIIPYNNIPFSNYQSSSRKRINIFIKILLKYRLIVTIRKVRGNDIHAACGQLSGKVINIDKKNNFFKKYPIN